MRFRIVFFILSAMLIGITCLGLIVLILVLFNRVKGTVGRGRCKQTDQDKGRLDKACNLHLGRLHPRKKDVKVVTLTGEQVTLQEMRRRAVRPMKE